MLGESTPLPHENVGVLIQVRRKLTRKSTWPSPRRAPGCQQLRRRELRSEFPRGGGGGGSSRGAGLSINSTAPQLQRSRMQLVEFVRLRIPRLRAAASEPRSGSTARRTHKVRISFGNRRRSELPRRCCSSGQIGASAPGPRSIAPVEKKLPSRLVLAHPNQSGRLRLHRTEPQAERRHPGRLLYASEGSPFSATADYLLAPERQGWGGAGPAGGGGGGGPF